ncbi:MAG: heme-binding protein [Mycobacterium sp.]
MSAAHRTGLRFTVAALGTAGAVLFGVPGTALADPPAGCTTADMTGVMSGVSAALAGYLLTHPGVNDFFTGLQGLPKVEVKARTEEYLNANPDVRADLEGIRAPSVDFRTRCNLPQRALILADI